MGKFHYEFVDSVLEKVDLQLISIEDHISVESAYSLGVDKDDYKKIKLIGEISLFHGKEEKPYIYIRYSAFFDTNNDKEKIEMKELEESANLINFVAPELSEMVSFLTRKAFGTPLELPTTVSNEDFVNDYT